MELTKAAADVLAERSRQVEAEGWTPEHDDAHHEGSMARAAATYAAHAAFGDAESRQFYACLWPWEKAWWKPNNSRRDLVKAGALILAEIERLDRLTPNAKFTGAEGVRCNAGLDAAPATEEE